MRNGDIVLERYRLEESLGHGGSSEVWQAIDIQTGTRVAVKLARPGYVAGLTEKVSEEAAILSTLEHPNIVRVRDYGSDAGRDVLVMELLEGRTLREVLRDSGSMDDVEVATIGFALADALAELHARGLVHCDVKPENIIITGGLVKLIDFGTARDLSQTLSPDELKEIAGTLAYLAPELLTGESHSAQSDLYALGVTLYEARAGRLPFSGGGGILAGSEGRRALPLRTVVPAVDTRVESVIMQMLAVDPAWRPPSAGEVRNLLSSGRHETVRLRPQKGRAVMPQPLPRKREAISAAAVAPETVPGPSTGREARPRAVFPTFDEWKESRSPQRTPARRVLVAVAAFLLIGAAGLTALLALGPDEGAEQAQRDDAQSANVGASESETSTSTAIAATNTSSVVPTRTAQPTATPAPATVTPPPTATPLAPSPTPPPPTSTSVPPTSTPVTVNEPVAQLDASAGVNTVVRWYDLLVAGRFDDAYALWSDRMKANFPRQGNLDDRWARTASVVVADARVVATSGNRMTVAIDFTETLANGNSRRFVGTWQLTASPDGWLLDQPSF